MEEIKEFSQIREILGEPNPVAIKKIYPYLNERMIKFIATSPIMMLSTVDSEGFPTVSPKGDKPGFVNTPDKNTLLIPELRGNKLAFSLANLVEQNKIGLIFIVPGSVESLRVHGTCRLVKSDKLCQSMASASHNALLVFEVRVTNAYFHCGKAFLRSNTWKPETWPEKIKVSFGQEIAENSDFIESLDAGVNQRYITDL